MEIKFSNAGGGLFELQTSQIIKRPLQEVFSFFSKAENLEILTPPFLKFKILSPVPITMSQGIFIDYRISLRGIPLKWRTEITNWNPPHSFTDVQVKGPYRLWQHTHKFTECAEGTLVEDKVNYKVLGGRLAECIFVRPDLKRIFGFRQTKLLEIFPV